MSNDKAHDFLMGGGVRAAFTKDDRPGTTVTGKVCEPNRVVQQIDYETNEPAVWNDGNPKEQMTITVQTTLNEPTDKYPEDDGIRRFYVKGNLKKAVAAAVRAANAKDVEEGGTISVTYTGEGAPTYNRAGKALNPPKLYAVRYVPPTATFLNGNEGGVITPGAAAPPLETRAPQAPTPPNNAGANPLAGLDEATIAALAQLAAQNR